MSNSTELDYIARQLLSTLWMLPEHIPLAAQIINQDGLLRPVPEYIWQVIKSHVGNGRLNIPAALAAIDRNKAAQDFMIDAQAENYHPRLYGPRQIKEWSEALAEDGVRRLGASFAEQLKADMNKADMPLDEIVSAAMSTLSALRNKSGSNTWRSTPEISKGARAVREAWARGQVHGSVLTGFYMLDRVMGGFRNGELSLIAARPSMGKTACACAIMLNVARFFQKEGKGRCVAFFSAETSGELLMLRLAYAIAGVDQTDSRTRQTTPEEEKRVDEAITLLESLPIYIDESAAPTTDNMLLRALALDNVTMNEKRSRVGIVFFDFIELAGDKDAHEEQRISKIARGLKAIAKQLDCPMVALSQLSRAADGRMPTLKDLRWSGMLEQIAYAIMFIHRESYYKQRELGYRPELDPNRQLAIWMVAKNKDGKVGQVEMRFEEEYTRFTDPHDRYLEHRYLEQERINRNSDW